MVIFAPLTTAPEGSVTVPWILPLPTEVCANSNVEDSKKVIASANLTNVPAGRTEGVKFRDIVHLPFRVGSESVFQSNCDFAFQSGGTIVHRVHGASSSEFPPANKS